MKKIAILSLSLTKQYKPQMVYFMENKIMQPLHRRRQLSLTISSMRAMTLASMLKSTRLTSITTRYWLVSIQTHHSVA